MKPIRKISDLPRITELANEHVAMIRQVDGKRVWVGGRVEDIIKYKADPPPTNFSVLVKRSNDKLRQHLTSLYAHWLEDKDAGENKAYSFSIETTRGGLELNIVSDIEPFEFDPSSEYLNFTDMFEKHVDRDLVSHKLYDENDGKEKWYKMARKIKEGNDVLFEMEIEKETENPEVFLRYSVQENDYGYNNNSIDDHVDNLYPHLITENKKKYKLVIEEDELVFELEEE